MGGVDGVQAAFSELRAAARAASSALLESVLWRRGPRANLSFLCLDHSVASATRTPRCCTIRHRYLVGIRRSIMMLPVSPANPLIALYDSAARRAPHVLVSPRANRPGSDAGSSASCRWQLTPKSSVCCPLRSTRVGVTAECSQAYAFETYDAAIASANCLCRDHWLAYERGALLLACKRPPRLEAIRCACRR